MSMSTTVEKYLNRQNIQYSLLEHPYSSTSMQAAHSAHITPAQMAKAVMVRGDIGYVMCVIPASHMLIVSWLNREFAGNYILVEENELEWLFSDCELGAIPALGQAYGIRVVWDSALRHADDVFFEAGDHRHLVHMRGTGFMGMMKHFKHATISCAPELSEYYRVLH